MKASHKVFETKEEALSHGKPFSDLCHCLECGCYWWLTDFLSCPRCGECYNYEDVEIPGIDYVK